MPFPFPSGCLLSTNLQWYVCNPVMVCKLLLPSFSQLQLRGTELCSFILKVAHINFSTSRANLHFVIETSNWNELGTAQPQLVLSNHNYKTICSMFFIFLKDFYILKIYYLHLQNLWKLFLYFLSVIKLYVFFLFLAI